MDGQVYNTVTFEVKSDNVFIYPYYITVLNSKTGRYIYVSDYFTNTITKLSMEGEIVSWFQDQCLSTPYGIVAMGFNHIGVCSCTGHSVTVISEQFEKKQLDCVQYPQAIEFSPQDNTLYVSSGGENENKHIHVYKLSK